jgi:hypothetical protein
MSINLKSPSSILGMYLVPYVKEFIITNQNMLINNPTLITPEIGAESLANAISYAVAKALGSPIFMTSLKAGICPGVSPGTAGTLISTALQPAVNES